MSNKFALLVGINYKGTSSALRGCISDVADMKQYLLAHQGYKEENITILTDDTASKPTAANIMHNLALLIMRAHTSKATEIWFHYSGHGSQVRDRSGDEKDGMDETLVPLDYLTKGMITDDTLQQYAAHLPKTCRMICIMDCCHSGTVFDLKYRYDGKSVLTENPTSTISSNIKLLSGCTDAQTSADAEINGHWCGAMTRSFLYAMDVYKDNPTAQQLISCINAYLDNGGYEQRPQLSCSEMLTDSTPFQDGKRSLYYGEGLSSV